MEYFESYLSDKDEISSLSEISEGAFNDYLKNTFKNTTKINIAPLVDTDISDNTINKSNENFVNSKVSLILEEENKKKKYMTGDVSAYDINEYNFNQEMYLSRQNLYNSHKNKKEKNFFTNESRMVSDYQKGIKGKINREKYGDPGSGDFKGPWACYKGEEVFSLKGELNEDQKEILNNIEKQRKEKQEQDNQDQQEKQERNLKVRIFYF